MSGNKNIITAAVLVALGSQANAQVPSGNAADGQRLSGVQCRGCHALDGQSRADEKAPSLTSIANMPSTTSLSLHVFLLTPHPSMPNYRLTPTEVDDVVAYILSLHRP